MKKDENVKQKLNILHALLAALVVLAMFVLVSIVCRITPFGDNTFLMGDLKRQYVDYYAYLRTILSGENDMTYSFSTTLGSGTTGFFAYYLSSPFLVILNLFPQNAMPVGVSVVICLKLMLAAFIMDLFIQRFISEQSFLVCSVSWAFSGYLFAHSMNMMWMDVIIMLPLAVWALEHILEINGKVPYIVVLCLMLIFNYYITYQVLLFLALWTIMRIFVRQDGNKVVQILRVAGATVTAICIDAAILVPTALELFNSPKDIGQLGLKTVGKNLNPIDIFSKLITCAYDMLEPRSGYPQLFCGVLMIFLLLMYFMDKGIQKSARIGMFAMFAILMVSFCLDKLNLLWHAGMEPSGHPYRQAFTWVFMAVCCCASALSGIKENLDYRRIILITAAIVIILILVALGGYDHAPLEVMVLNFALVLLYFFLLCGLVFCEKNSLKALSVLISTILFAVNLGDLSLNAVRTFDFLSTNGETASFYSETVSKNLEAVDYVKGKDSSFYRMEILNPRQQNDALQYNYNGITHYSSSGMIYVRYFLQRLGFNDTGLFTAYGHDNTALADMLLGVKYVISDGTYTDHIDYFRIYGGDVQAYENPRPLELAVETVDYDLGGISDLQENEPDTDLTHVPATDPFSLQEDMLSRLMGKEIQIFEPADVNSSSLQKSEENKYYIDHEVTATEDGEMYMYLNGLIGASEGLMVYVDGEFLTTYGNASCVKILNLGYMKAGESTTIRVEGEKETDDLGEPLFVTEDISRLGRAYKELSSRNCEVIRKRSSDIEIHTGECNGVVTSVPFESGWKVTVDGQEVSPVAIYDSLIYVPVDAEGNSHIIEMRFSPTGKKEGIIISIAGLVMLAVIILLDKKQNKQ